MALTICAILNSCTTLLSEYIGLDLFDKWRNRLSWSIFDVLPRQDIFVYMEILPVASKTVQWKRTDSNSC